MRTLSTGYWLSAVAILVAGSVLAAPAAKKKPGPTEPLPQTRTFFIDGVKTEADVKAITEAAMKVTSVTKVDKLTPESGFANISFDHHAVTHQQIAQAIADAGPFQVTFRFAVPQYAAHAEALDAIFAKVKDQVDIQPTNKENGEFVLRFLPLKSGKGFNLGRIGHPIADAPPKGLGLKIISVSKPASKAPAKKPRKQ